MQFFSPGENTALSALPASERQNAFFRCWTRKEAFVKAFGGGLSIPLNEFEVSLAPDQPAQLLRIYPDLGDISQWALVDFSPFAGFAAALAVQGPPAHLRYGFWSEDGETAH
jgi:4'-phosphopantetheinyl transferase